jgi:hypothetical protein
MTWGNRRKRYNPRKRKSTEKMIAMRLGLISWVLSLAGGLAGLIVNAAPVRSPWEGPAAGLADQVAGIMGPGQAQLTIGNISSIPAADVPGIRKLLEQDLKARGVVASGAESANSIRVTLSENVRERLWVAEVLQGNETRVAMVELGPAVAPVARTDARIVLRKERLSGLTSSDEPILFAAQAGGDMIVVHADDIAIGSLNDGAWKEQKRVAFGRRQNASRDPRGFLQVAESGMSFTAYAPGVECSGAHSNPAGGATTGNWPVQCHEGDDPWPLLGGVANGMTDIKAFFNAGRNYFTGVVTPAVGVDLPPFYSALLIPRSAGGLAVLINGIDGKVQMVDNGVLMAISGARDWGSDFAVLHSGCGAGTQVIASQSGEAANDSLRAYEIPAVEAVGASAPLTMDGAVTALWTDRDSKSVLAVVRNAANDYEVDRVTALCN